MSSATFFESSDCENTQQFWEGASSGPATQSPRRERHPSTRPVFARLDTPTPTGPACRGIPQTRRPQRRAPINNNSTRKDITIWNHQKHTHRRDSEDIAFGLLVTQTDILLQMPSNRTLVAMQFTPSVPCRFWVRSDRLNLVYDGNPRNRSRPSVRHNIVEKHRNVVGTRRNS